MDETATRHLDRQTQHALRELAQLDAEALRRLLRPPGFANVLELATALAKGWVLAHFVLGDPDSSFAPVRDAVRELRVELANELRRRKDRDEKGRNPNLAFLEPAQHFQVLVLEKCTPLERNQERQRGILSAEDVVIRYVKHLVELTLEQGSLHVNLAISRILLGYAPRQVWAVQRLLLGKSEPPAQGEYSSDPLRRRLIKNTRKLGQDLAERFEHLQTAASTETPPREAKRRKLRRRTATRRELEEWKGHAEATRRLLHPGWAALSGDSDSAEGVHDLFPTRQDPAEWPGLRQDGETAADLGRLETARMTALVLPEIHSLLTASLGLPDPGERLHVPAFLSALESRSLHQEPPDQDPPAMLGGRFPDRPLGAAEISSLAARMALDQRVRAHPPRRLEIRIDGEHHGAWAFRDRRRLDLRVPRGARRVRLVAEQAGDSVTVATFRMTDLLDERHVTFDLESKERVTLELASGAGVDPEGLHDPDALASGEWRATLRSEPIAASRWAGLRRAIGRSLGTLWPRPDAVRPRRLVALAATALLAFGLSYFVWAPAGSPDPPGEPRSDVVSGVAFRQLIPGDGLRATPGGGATRLHVPGRASGLVLVIPSDYVPQAEEYRLDLEGPSGTIWSADRVRPIDGELTIYLPARNLIKEPAEHSAGNLYHLRIRSAAGTATEGETITIPFRVNVE